MALTSTSYTTIMQVQRDGSVVYNPYYGQTFTIGRTVVIDGSAQDLTGLDPKIYISKYRTDTTPTILNGDSCTVSTVTTNLYKYNITPDLADTMTRGNYYFWIKLTISEGITRDVRQGVIVVK